MSRRFPDRAGAMAGIGFTACALAATVIVPQPPAFDAGAGQIRDYLTGNEDGLSVAALLASAAGLFFLLFVAMVAHRIAVAEGRFGFFAPAFVVAGTAAGSMALLGGVFQSALVNRVAPFADDSALRSLYGLGQLILYVAPSLAMVPALAVAAAATIRHGTFARPTAWVAIVAALLNALTGAVDIASGTDAFEPLGLFGFLLTNVWLVWVSIAVLRGRAGDVGEPLRAERSVSGASR